MTALSIELVGFDAVLNKVGRIPVEIRRQMPELFRSLGVLLQGNVQKRIITRDSGAWAEASKWSRAKSGQKFPTLLGAEKYVKFKVSQQKLQVYGSTGTPEWTLTQHHEGFYNELTGPRDKFDEHGRVVIKIKDAEPLNLYAEYRKKRDGTTKQTAQVFAFRAYHQGYTPARKIWPSRVETESIVQPEAVSWLLRLFNIVGWR